MLQFAAQDVGNDLHVAVRMRAKAHPGAAQVVIDDPQCAEAHPFRIVVIREAEGVIRIAPAMFRMAAFTCFSNLHHGKTKPQLSSGAPVSAQFSYWLFSGGRAGLSSCQFLM